MNRRRLDFEAMRDALLAVVRPARPRPWRPVASQTSDRPERDPRGRSTAHLDRLNLPGVYRTFDFPDPDATSPQRDQTTVPPQALFLMNHPFVAECAKNLRPPAGRGALDGPGRKLNRVYRDPVRPAAERPGAGPRRRGLAADPAGGVAAARPRPAHDQRIPVVDCTDRGAFIRVTTLSPP